MRSENPRLLAVAQRRVEDREPIVVVLEGAMGVYLVGCNLWAR